MTTNATPAAPADRPWENLFGVCACLGEDLGFNPLYLRIALGASLLWNPVAVIVAYFGMGLVVLATRLLFPNPKPVTPASVAEPVAARIEQEPLPLAA